MSRAKEIKRQIVGKAKQAIGEIIGDQQLHEDGKAESNQNEDGRDETNDRNPLNPLNKLNWLTLRSTP